MTPWTDNAFGNDWRQAYNGHEDEDAREPLRGGKMRKTLTTVRCVPRYGYEYTQVRTVDLELLDIADEQELLHALRMWFAHRGIADAVYDVAIDANGLFAIINDEAYHQDWGEAVL
jgi:hypothetical protein